MFDAIVKRNWKCCDLIEDRECSYFVVTCYLRIFFPYPEEDGKILYEAEAWKIGTSGYGWECTTEDLIRITDKKVRSRVAVETRGCTDVFYDNRYYTALFESKPLPLRYCSTEVHTNN